MTICDYDAMLHNFDRLLAQFCLGGLSCHEYSLLSSSKMLQRRSTYFVACRAFPGDPYVRNEITFTGDPYVRNEITFPGDPYVRNEITFTGDPYVRNEITFTGDPYVRNEKTTLIVITLN